MRTRGPPEMGIDSMTCLRGDRDVATEITAVFGGKTRVKRPWLIVSGCLLALLAGVLAGQFGLLSQMVVTVAVVVLCVVALATLWSRGVPLTVRSIAAAQGQDDLIATQGELLKAIALNSPVGIVTTDTDGKIVFSNAVAAQVLGAATSDIAERGFRDPTWNLRDETGRVLGEHETPLAIALEQQRQVRDMRVSIAGGEAGDREILVNAAPLLDAQGARVGAVSTFLDITDRVYAERDARATEALVRNSMNVMMEGCQILDHNWVYLYINDTAQMHNRRPREELLGRRYAEMWPGITETRVYSEIEKVLKQRVSIRMENEFTYPEGGVAWFELSIQPVPQGVLILSTDITARKADEYELALYRDRLQELVEQRTAELAQAMERVDSANEELTAMNEELMAVNEELAASNEELDLTNEELAAANNELDAANAAVMEATRAKSRFLASMSHELRTPLNSIIGFSGVLAAGMAGPLTEEQQRQIQMINTAGEHLLSLINGILDLSKVEAGAIAISCEEFDACEIAQQVADTVSPLAAEKGLYCRTELPDGPRVIRSDPGKVRQMLLNLLGNAVKFTEEGGVLLKVSVSKTGDAEFTVIDTGPGIHAEDRGRIFEPFVQVRDPESAREPVGTGLGLAISREHAQALGGGLTLESEPGEGCTFVLRLPRLDGDGS